MKRIAILTGGGDAPGLNGILESVTRSLTVAGYEVVGICDGFDGVFEGRTLRLEEYIGHGDHSHAGSVIGTSNRTSTRGREKEFLQKLKSFNVDGMVVAGGDGTFDALSRVWEGLKIVGVPKTIDNDLQGTDFTFGFDTAVSVVANAVDSLRRTAETHRRVMIVETMGRTAGWIALGGGLAGYADVILIPEIEFDRAKLAEFIRAQRAHKRGLMVVVSEGAKAKNEDVKVAFEVAGAHENQRLGGVSFDLARWIEEETGWEARNVVLGHLQRSSAPTVSDRFLTMSMGIEAARAVQEGDWGKAIVSRAGQIVRAPITDLMKPPRLVPPDHNWVKMGHALGIFI
ncbi:MAG: ATP-dependent 6-phosphofructokinase [Bdellovibrionaceae bacterium]|nr:ATP-dependent 6-phosphofructokinase [Pseudobdellovibrionaceae bacterium]